MMSDDKVVHIHAYFVPNMGYQENYLPSKLNEIGVDVEIITSDKLPPKFQGQLEPPSPGEEIHNGVKVHRLESLNMNSVSKCWMKGLESKLDDIEPKIIQSRNVLSIQSIRAAKYVKNNNIKLLVDDHVDNDNFHLDTTYKSIGFKIFQMFFLPGIKRETDVFLPVQPYSREFLHDNYDIPYGKMKILPLGVDTDKFYRNKEEGRKKREELDIGTEFLIIFAGNFGPSKDLDVLLNATSFLPDDIDYTLLLLGKPRSGMEEYYNKLENLSSELGISDKVIFHDFVDHDELSKFFNAADIGVWPGKLGITTAEAVGCGIPIIVCASDATTYLIENNNGISFQRGNENDLADVISEYAKNRELLVDHQKRALDHAKTTLSWNAIAEKNARIYDELI